LVGEGSKPSARLVYGSSNLHPGFLYASSGLDASLNQGYSVFAMPRARAAPMLASRPQIQIQTRDIA
jgi:hypothetical protein